MSIIDWEAGRRVPRDLARLADLAQVLQLSPSEADQLIVAALNQRDFAEGDPVDLPPPSPASGHPPATLFHQLRAPIADFVGRAAETQQLCTALQAALTSGGRAIIGGVRGMGGIGKTEVAYSVAHDLRSVYPDAQIVLELHGSSATPLTPRQALQAVIRTFIPEARLPAHSRELELLYRSVLHEKRVLILADDARDAAQVRPLIPPAGCALLITSRQRFTLPGMTLIDLAVLNEDAAVTLVRSLCTRLSVGDARALARACGYLPLALRISGSVLHNDPALDVTTYLQHLADERQRLEHLRDPDDPQLDVAAALELSYVQLDGAAQQIFRQLGALEADFSTELALAVVAAPPAVDVAAVLHQLLRHNLVMYDSAHARWRLHDLVRDLARGALERAGERDAAAWRYARAALGLAQEVGTQYLASSDGVMATLACFEVERPHLDAAHRWAVRHARTREGDRLLKEVELAMRYIELLWYSRRYECSAQLESVHTAAQQTGERRTRGRASNYLGVVYAERGEVRPAILYFEQALAIARPLGDQRAAVWSLNNLGNAYVSLGEVRRAILYHEQALTVTRWLGDRRSEGRTLLNLGNAYVSLGEIRRAIPYHEQALAIIRASGERRNEGVALHNLGESYVSLGEFQDAIPYFEQALAIARAIGQPYGQRFTLTSLGFVYIVLGEWQRALEAYESAHAIMKTLGYRRQEGDTLNYLAHVQVRQGDIARACATFDQALTLIQSVGARREAATCQWEFGLALVQQGEYELALPLLRAAITYEQEIDHAQVAARTALLARLEAGETLPPDLVPTFRKRAVGTVSQ